MGAAFWTAGTVKIRKYLHNSFAPNKIKGTANNFLPLFDPANAYTISEALVGMDLPPRADSDFGAKLQQRFVLLFDNMRPPTPATAPRHMTRSSRPSSMC